MAYTQISVTPGNHVGPYEILSSLGAGGMGEVYRARDTRLNREVALKILPPEMAGDPTRRQRFELEGRALAALNHPNIVAVYDVGENYFVSELVEGRPLCAGNPGLRNIIPIAIQIANGLAAAHEAGIVHRDLKPQNIFLTHDGRPKILDFGLAKLHEARGAADSTATMRTQPGMVMGTPGYMSPEQVRGLPADQRSDIFSFGVILSELLSGRRTFEGETPVEVMAAILKQDAPELPETVPPALRQIVAHCLEKEPKERFQSARDLAFALTQAAGGGSYGAGPKPRSARIRVRRGLAVAALIVGSVAATRWLWRDAGPAPWTGVLLQGPAMALDPRLSPDGNLMAFRVFEDGQTQVAIMNPDSGNVSVLTHRRDRGAVDQVSWSADGSQIYYGRLTDVPHGVYSIPALGGEERLLLEDANSPEALPDGSLLVTRLTGGVLGRLYRFWPETGRLVEFALEKPTHSAPASSRAAPGAREVFTYASPIGAAKRLALYAIDIATNAVRQASFGTEIRREPQAWTVTRDGKWLLAAFFSGSITQVMQIPSSGNAAGRVLFTTTSPVWYLEAGKGQSVFVNTVERPKEVLRLAAGSAAAERMTTIPVEGADQVLALPDGRAVALSTAGGRARLIALEERKNPVPLVNTQEATSPPMTLAGPGRIAFMIGPPPHTIAIADTTTGLINHRIAPGKGDIGGISASADGGTIYFCAGGTVWSVVSSGGEARAVCPGAYAVVDRSDRGLIVVRGQSSHIRMFHVPLDGGAEREIPLDRSTPVYGEHAGTFSSGSLDARGRLLVSLSPFDSWFNSLGILDTESGRIARVPVDRMSDHHSGVWTGDGSILFTETRMRALVWKFMPTQP